MKPFTCLTGIAAPLPRDNVDTDAIIAARSMEGGVRGLGPLLFTNWRYDTSNAERPEFVLNQPRYRAANFIVAGRNFGCGSSREMAVWALLDYGIRAVIAAGFGDIFYENCLQNGLLPITLDMTEINTLTAWLDAAAEPALTVDLQQQGIIAGDLSFSFEIDPERRGGLLEAKDDFALLIEQRDEIRSFAERRRQGAPWLFGRWSAGVE